VQCEHCEIWFHYSCAKLSSEEVDRIENFFCSQCESEHSKLTTWKAVRPNKQQKLDKLRNYHEVEKILSSKTVGATRKFFVKWKKYSSRYNSWEPEKNLDGCLDLLQQYLKRKNLPLSTMTGLLGAAGHVKFNRSNWITMDRIVKTVNGLKNIGSYKSSLEVSPWDGSLDRDRILLLDHDSHCYVICYLSGQSLGYIADGTNNYMNDGTAVVYDSAAGRIVCKQVICTPWSLLNTDTNASARKRPLPVLYCCLIQAAALL